MNRTRMLLALALASLLALSGCGKSSTSPGNGAPRSYRMGFAAGAPRFELNLLFEALDQWMGTRSDAALISQEAPWDSLLTGVAIDSLVMRQQLPLAQLYRSKGLDLWVFLDPANGFNRGGENLALLAHGRSITEPEIQRMYRDYVVACDTILRPSVLGVALETNLIRIAAPAPLYAAIKQVANDAAADVRAVDPTVKLGSSVQVETAWGVLGPPRPYEGIETDFIDFPYLQVLGLSSYPYFSWGTPEALPPDYYSRLLNGRTMPVGITEGGWTSETVAAFPSSPELQRRYIVRQSQLLETVNAQAWFQLTYTDIEVFAGGLGVPPATLAPFARTGLVDTTLAGKPARTEWDAVFARPRR
ncbi:MAG: hypothetical protein K8R56_09865 [Candidatus Eisenbacteria bacterium]|nr:hypothetical protein [Candidatus Eisenbacteria bacterium]